MDSIYRLFSYARPRSLMLVAAAMSLALLTMLIAFAGSWPLVQGALALLTLLLWLPLLFDLAPVIWCVLVHGRWPDRPRYFGARAR